MFRKMLELDAWWTKKYKKLVEEGSDLGDVEIAISHAVDRAFNDPLVREAAAQLKIVDTGKKIIYTSLSPEELAQYLETND